MAWVKKCDLQSYSLELKGLVNHISYYYDVVNNFETQYFPGKVQISCSFYWFRVGGKTGYPAGNLPIKVFNSNLIKPENGI